MRQIQRNGWLRTIAALIVLVLCTFNSYAQDSLCASVRIEIIQELAFERQGFDAMMRITNALDDIAIENVNIDVHLLDENSEPVLATSDPDNTQASFFVRLDSMSGITDINGNGTIAPQTAADIHWLIVPAPGAGGSSPNGTLYYAGATLRYSMNGEEVEVEVSPDSIFVKPMPLLKLDYFLPKDVYADDAFTAIIEPPVPFDLGVRITNNGHGLAGNVSIDSAQPKIIDNELGLLIDFVITGSSMNDQPVAPTLLIPFGDLAGGQTAMGRWQMETTLSGEFVEFTAEYSHADELGGELTSLLEGVETHQLVHNVLVDLAGRDSVRDFLAKDGDVLRVYESSGLNTQVTDQSAQSQLSWLGNVNGSDDYQLQAPATDGFFYVKMADPHSGLKTVSSVFRTDGKTLPADNVWFSQERREDNGWDYYLHVFDVNTNGQYQLGLVNKTSEPVAPVLQFIGDKQVAPGNQVSFIVEASDLNGTLPTVSVQPLPAGAQFFVDPNGPQGISTYIFDWTPSEEQVGVYPLTFIASDGQFQTAQNMSIRVCDTNDADCDGMDDQWELDNFGTLSRDGTADFDGDGFTDLEEYLNQTNPLVQDPPGLPEIVSPLTGSVVTVLQPLFEVKNATHGDYGVNYEFEVFSDETYSTLVTQAIVSEQVDNTVWDTVPELVENSIYHWRVRACNQDLCSEWVNATFQVNLSNQAPGLFGISSPQIGTAVDSLTPTLSVTNSSDPDGDTLQYRFVVFADALGEQVLLDSGVVEQGAEGITSWTVSESLNENQVYHWNVEANDPQGLTTSLPEFGRFQVNTENSAPTAPVVSSPSDQSLIEDYQLALSVVNSVDDDGDSLVYLFEIDTVETFSSDKIKRSDPIAEGVDTTDWLISELEENTRYFWRAKADDGTSQSPWVSATFYVSAVDEAPSDVVVENPGDGAWVDTLRPQLRVMESVDPEQLQVTYQFELYSDPGLATTVATYSGTEQVWALAQDLSDNNWYYWRARAVDPAGNASDWSVLSSFFIDDNGVNDAPQFTFAQPASDIFIEQGELQIAWTDEDPDSNALISFYYELDTQGIGGTSIVSNLSEDSDIDQYQWDVTGLTPGTYYLYAIIDDGETSVKVYAPGVVYLGSIGQGTINIQPVTEVSEPGVCFAFDLSLGVAPRKAVQISYDLDNNSGVVSPLSMSFTAENWSEPLRLNITGLSNCEYVSGIVATLHFAPVISDDPAYAGLQPENQLLQYSQQNQAPVAEAGTAPDSEVGDPISLDGSGSYDTDAFPQPLTYAWTFDNVPLTSTRTDIDLILADTDAAAFIADVPGEYVLRLVVSDGELSDSDTVTVVVSEATGPLLCDVDGNGVVEQVDVLTIMANRNQPASGDNDPMDADGDGVITVLDVRICQARL